MDRESLLRIWETEPDRTIGLLKVAAGGAVILAFWAMIVGDFMTPLLFFPLTLVLLGLYAGIVTLVTVDLVQHSDRWQVESVLQTRRLVSSGGRQPLQEPAPVSAAAAPSATHANAGRGAGASASASASASANANASAISANYANSPSASFDQWYFVLRLEEEIKTARRTGSTVSIAIMSIMPPGREPTPALVEQINFDVAKMASNHSKSMAMPNAIGPLEYAFILPESDRDEARSRVAPLLNPLGDYWCEFGIACYPRDGTEAESLVTTARKEIEDIMTKSKSQAKSKSLAKAG